MISRTLHHQSMQGILIVVSSRIRLRRERLLSLLLSAKHLVSMWLTRTALKTVESRLEQPVTMLPKLVCIPLMVTLRRVVGLVTVEIADPGRASR